MKRDQGFKRRSMLAMSALCALGMSLPSHALEYSVHQANASYLNDVQFRGQDEDPLGDLLTEASARQYRQRYADMNRSYELKQQYRLNGRQDDLDHLNAMSRFTLGIAKDIQNQKVKTTVKNVEKAALSSEELEPIKAPIAVAFVAASLYVGRNQDFKISDDMRLSTRTEIRAKQTSVNLKSNVCNASARYDGNAEDKAAFGVGRGLGILDLQSGLSYGANTNNMSASLSKDLYGGLTASVGQSRNLETSKPGESSVRLSYGLSF